MREKDTHPDRHLEAGLSQLRKEDPERLRREMLEAPEVEVVELQDDE